MADNVSNVTLNVSDKGTLEVLTKAANKLRKELEGAQKAAGGVRTPTPVTAARAASSRESGLARSVGEGGGTGSSTRDFARQAEGLGGLVRIYATFAANIFAVTAAFGALSRAADTANLIKGLDQLGAASGRNLGSLAKQLVETTDGAISLKEALTATSQASSGGLSNANILKLGQVAKQASQALGIDMVNAVSRLSRGITKLEPELLDEIGIFVRVDKASADYARSIGKSAAALTDFEKRQAFANAVLEQGAAKFGAVQLDANPYSKIQASLENLSFTALNVVNTVFTPLLNILSSSPTTLGLVIAGLANVLLRQAIPAIGQYRERLAQSAASARDLVVQTNALRKDQKYAKESAEGLAIGKRVVDTKANAKALDADIEKLKQSRAIRESISKILPKASTGGEEELIKLKRTQLQLEKEISTSGISPALLAKRGVELDTVKKITKAIELRRFAELEADKVDEKVSNNKLLRASSLAAAQDRIADRAAAKSQRVNILNDVSTTLPSKGVRESFAELNKQVNLARQGLDKNGDAFDNNQKKMGMFNGAATRVIGTAQILGSALGTVVSSLGQFAVIATIVIALGQAVYSFFAKAAKEAEVFASSSDALTSALDNVDRTLEGIRKKIGAEVISVASINAAATAMNDLADAALKASEDFQKLISARGGLESAVDWIYEIFGKGDKDKLSAGIAGSINKTLKSLPVGPAREEATKKLNAIFDVKDLSVKSLSKALNNLSDSDAASKAREIGKALKEISTNAVNSAGNLTSMEAGLKETSKLVNDLNNSLKPNDAQGKLGASLINDSFAINKALENPINGITTLKRVIDDVNLLSILPPSYAEELAKASVEINKVAEAAGNAETAVATAQAKVDELRAKSGSTRKISRSGLGQNTDFGKELAAAEDSLKRALAANESAKARAAQLTADFADLGTKAFASGFDKLIVSLKGAIAEGGITAAKGYLSVLKEAGGATADSENKLAQQQIGIQIDLVKSNFAQVEQAKKLELQLQETNALTKIALAKANITGNNSRTDKAPEDLVNAYKQLDVLERQKKLVSSGSTKDFRAAGTSADPLLQEAAAGVKDFFVVLFGKEGQLAKLYGESASQRIQGDAKKINETAAQDKKPLDRNLAANTEEQKRLDILKNITGLYDEEIQKKQVSLELSTLTLNAEKALLDNTAKINLANLAIANARKGTTDKAEAEKAKNDTALQRLTILKQFETDRQAVESKGARDRIAGANAVFAIELKNSEGIRLANKSVSEGQLDALEAEISYLQATGRITDENAAKSKQVIENSKEEARSYERLVELGKARSEIERAYQEQVAAASAITNDTDRTSQLEKANQARLASLGVIDAQVNAETRAVEVKKYLISLTASQTIEQAQLNERLKEQQAVLDLVGKSTQSLATLFGDMGKAVGEATTAIIESGYKQLAVDKELADNKKKYSKPEDKDKLLKAESKAAYETADIQLGVLETVASSTKKLFKEKTAAAKAFAAAEKTIAVARLALSVKETAIQLGLISTKTTAEVASVAPVLASEGAKAGASGTSAIAAAFAAPFPVGFVAGAAMIAIISSLLGKSMGKSGSIPKGFSAEEQQKVQGTGQMYQDGQLVNRGGGALGDNSAIAESLNNGISKIEEHTFSSLEYSNKMLDNLKGIKKNTEGLSALILQSGLNTQGINPDSSTQFGVTGVKVQNADFGNKLLEPIFNAIGISKTSGIGKLAGRISTAIFGGKTTTELQDVGIAFNGTIGKLTEQLKMGGQDLAALYENIKVTTSGGWFRSDKTSFETSVSNLDRLQAEAFGNIFEGIGNTVRSAAEALGKDSKAVEASISSFDVVFKTSFKDLKPEELTKALEAEFSVTFNQLAEKVLPEFQKFRKAGEEFGDTIIRLARDVQVVSLLAESAGFSIGDISKYQLAGEATQETLVRVTETFINAAGGLDNLVSKTQFYVENFLTDAERLAPVQARLTAELKRLGLSSVDTVDEFKQAVNAAVALGPAGADLYVSLLNVAEAFDAVYNAEKDAKDKESKIASIEREILDTLGFSYNAILIARREELLTLTDAERVLKSYLYAQQDLMKTQSLLLETMELEASAADVLQYKRAQELKALSTGDQLLKIRIYRLQDEKKLLESSNSQKIKILELLGQKEEVLNIKRKAELETLDAQLVPAQMYIYALEDEAALRDELNDSYKDQNTSLKEIISSTRSAIKSLKDYRSTLLQSDLSNLDPSKKYAKAKQEALDLARIASSVATTEIERIQKDDALSKLPGATNAWLEASRVLFASSEAYNSDFNTVLTILDNTESALTAQLSDAEKQQKLIEDTNSYLDSINGSTRTTAEILQLLYEAQIKTAEAKMELPTTTAVAKDSFATAKIGASGILGASDTIITGTSGYVGTIADTAQRIRDYINAGGDMLELRNKFVSEGITSQMVDSIMGYEPGTALRYVLEKGIPAFKMGGSANGLSLVGEQGPELVNFSNPARVYSNNQTDSILNNGALVKEIISLRNEVSQLRAEQKQQTADVIKTNYDANARAANEIATSNEEASKQGNWDSRASFKLA